MGFKQINMKFKKNSKKSDFHFDEQNERILLDISTLRLGFHKLANNIKQSRDWMTMLGLTVSLGATLFASDFKSVFGLSSENVQAIFIISTFISGVLTVSFLIRCFILYPHTKEDSIIDFFRENSKIPVEYRVLFIIKSNQIKDIDTLLFFKDEIWNCFFLPNLKTEAIIKTEEIINKVSVMLNIEKANIMVDLYDIAYDKTSEKYSAFHKCTALYYSKFCYIKIRNPPLVMKNQEFIIQNRKFKWMTTAEILNDPQEKLLNSDIIRHLEDFNEEFFIQPANSVQFIKVDS
jgi:hypothetical protein